MLGMQSIKCVPLILYLNNTILNYVQSKCVQFYYHIKICLNLEKKTTIIVSIKISFAYETIYLQKLINNYFIKSRVKICINKQTAIYKRIT